MDPILLVASVLVFAAILTWILPAGRFDRVRDEKNARTVVVPGSYHATSANPVGPWSLAMSVPQGLSEAAAVIF